MKNLIYERVYDNIEAAIKSMSEHDKTLAKLFKHLEDEQVSDSKSAYRTECKKYIIKAVIDAIKAYKRLKIHER